MSNDLDKIKTNYSKKISPIKFPSIEIVSYKVETDGIVKVTDVYDQHKEHMATYHTMFLTKEVFIEAYNTYIKGEKEHETT